jgi:ATP-dependent DNA helicase
MRRDQLGIAAKGQGGARYIEAEDLPIILTTYETAMNDVKFFENTKFSFMVVDESHRLKNKDCKLVKQLKQYQTENRLLLTGTPLQVSTHRDCQQWGADGSPPEYFARTLVPALLHPVSKVFPSISLDTDETFISPDVFKDPDIFVKGFDLSAVTQSEEASRVASDAAAAIAAQLHRILQPWVSASTCFRRY